MRNVAELPDPLAEVLMSALSTITTIDISICSLRSYSFSDVPGQWYRDGGWVEMVEWGTDSCVSAVRLALMGQFVGASAILRQQLERWTTYLAGSYNLDRSLDQSIQQHVTRIWSHHISSGMGSILL